MVCKMDPRKEALSLKEFPLPEEVGVSPTSIAILGNSIENLEREIADLNVPAEIISIVIMLVFWIAR